MGGNPYDTFRKAQEQQQAAKKEQTTEATTKNKPLISDNQGEYIDYEEVK